MDQPTAGSLDKGQLTATKLDQRKLQSDIKTLTKKATGLLQSMNDRLKDLRDKNQRLALEQKFIVVQPSWGVDQQPTAAAAAAVVGAQLQQHGAAGGEQAAASSSSSSSSGGGVAPAAAAAPDGTGALVPRGGAGGASSSGAAAGLPPLLQVERDAALMSPFIQKEVVQNGMGLPGAPPVLLPKQVTPDSWEMVLEYCRFHLVPGRSDKERRMFDERFIKVETNLLCELTSAADALDMRPLVDLASRAIAKMIEGKSPDQIREAFRLPDDLTEEEKLEPLRTVADDPRIRMLNRLYARKRKELQERKAQLLQAQQHAQQWQAAQAGGEGAATAAAVAATTAQPDTRSLDELLSFIEDGDGGAKVAKAGGKAKSKKKKAKQQKVQGEEASGAADDQPQVAPQPQAAPAAASSEGGCAAALPPRPPSSTAGAAGAGASRSPASTLPLSSQAGTSGRSSLDSSPERLSMHSTLSSGPPSPGVPSVRSGAAAAGSTAPAMPSSALAAPPPSPIAAAGLLAGAVGLPRPPLWLPGLRPPASLPGWLADDELMHDYEDQVDSLAVPLNPFAARTVLLHRPITTLTSLSAFRAAVLPESATPGPHPPGQSQIQPDAEPRSLPGAAAAAAAVGGGAGAAEVPAPAQPQQQHRAQLQQLVAADRVEAAPGLGQAVGLGSGEAALSGAAAAQGSGSSAEGGPAGADAEGLAALLLAFLADLGLQQHLRVVPGPQYEAAVPPGSGLRAAGSVERSGVLPGGGVLELRWRGAAKERGAQQQQQQQ